MRLANLLRRLRLLRRYRHRLAYLLAAATVILLMLALGQENAIPFSNWGAIPGAAFVIAGIGLAAFLTHRGLLGGGRGIGPFNAAIVMRVALQHVWLLALYIATAAVGLLVSYPGASDDVIRTILGRPSGAGTATAETVPPGWEQRDNWQVRSEPYRAALTAKIATITRRPRNLPGDALGDYYYRTATQQLAQRLAPLTEPGARRSEIRAYIIGTGTAIAHAASTSAAAPSHAIPTLNNSALAYTAFWQAAVHTALNPTGTATASDFDSFANPVNASGIAYTPTPEEHLAAQAGELFSALLLALEVELDILIGNIINGGHCSDWLQVLGTLPPGMTPATLMQQYSTQPGSTVAPIIVAFLRGTDTAGKATAGGTTVSGTTNGGGTTGGDTGSSATDTSGGTPNTWPAIEAEILRIYRTDYSEASHRRELLDSYRRADGRNVAWLEQNKAAMTPTERAAYERAVEIAARDGGPPLDERYRAYNGRDTAALRALYQRYRSGQ